jgi:quercetin dioxygenase-like cupin family protein
MLAQQMADHITWSSRSPNGRQQKVALKIPLVALTIAVMLAPAAHAEPAPQDSGQNPVVRPVFDQPANVPGKSLQAVTVSYPPGARSAAHHHAKSAFIMVYVISGSIRSQLEGEPARVYQAGETWSEAPGAHHTISENASTTEPAELLAVFLLDAGDDPLTTDDTVNTEPPR